MTYRGTVDDPQRMHGIPPPIAPGGAAPTSRWYRRTVFTKREVREFWDSSTCGEVYALEGDEYGSQSRTRYELEPYLRPFARFEEGRGKDVLEIGVGMGADHLEWAQSRPRRLCGIDLTPRAVDWTRRRLAEHGFVPEVEVGDAEELPFDDGSFDIVFSYGVLHVSPDTPKAFREVHRVLRPGGVARLMIYHRGSILGLMLWLRYGLMAGRPWRGLDYIYAHHLESPGTKAYSVTEAMDLVSLFDRSRIDVQISFAELLLGAAGQRHHGPLLDVARRVWPRRMIHRYAGRHGLLLLIEAVK